MRGSMARLTIKSTVHLFFLVLLCCWNLSLHTVEAWPYVDCSATNSIFTLQQVTAHYDHSNNSIGLSLQGNFTDTYWAQGYTDAATSKWRTSIQTTIMGTQLYRSEGPACMADGGMIVGGCPKLPGLGTIQTSFNISQAAPFAELMVTMQIVGSNNQSIVCVAVLLEQTMETVNNAVSFLPLALACFSGAISLAATFMRASIGNGFLGAAATYGMATEPISVHTPGFFDVVFYTQFMLMTGQLAVNYPSFYSTFTALFHWSFLEFRDTLLGKGPANATEVLTFGGAGSVNQDSRAGASRSGISRISTATTTTTTTAATTTEGTRPRKRDLDYCRQDRQDDTFFVGQDMVPMVWAAKAVSTARVTLAYTKPAAAQVYPEPTQPVKRGIEIAVDPSPSVHSPSTHVSPPTSPPSSPPPSPSPHTSPPASPSPHSPSPKPSTKPSVSSRPPKPTSKPNPPPTKTLPSQPPASSTSPVLIIPTIRDAFSNSSESNIQHNVSRFGIESYIAAIGAFPSTLFLGTLINAALAMVVALLLSGGFLGIAWMMAKEKHQRGKTLQHALNFVAGNMLRVWSLLYTPLALSAMYQLTISGGVGLTVGSAASLLFISVGATIFFTWRILRGSSEHLLFDDLGTLLKYGPLYNTLAQEGTLFFLVTLLVRFLWGLAVAMLPSYGVAQVAVLMVIELGYTLVIGVKWPFSESTDNKFHLFLGIIRIVITGLSVGYIHEIEASPETRELLAYIQMALHLTVFVVMFALTLWNLIQVCMFWHARHSDTWRGPTKTYSFEDPAQEVEQGWGLNGRPFLHSGATHSRGVVVANNSRPSGDADDDDDFGTGKNRRFTVMSYSSLGSSTQNAGGSGGARRESMQHALHAPMRQNYESSDDETLRYGSPAERYRQSRLVDHRRSALNQSASSETGSVVNESSADRGMGYMGPVILSSSSAVSGIKAASAPPSPETTTGDQRQPSPRQSHLAANRGNLPLRDSYASLQRMSHQQPPVDPRTRRMSDITRDGPYLYNPQKGEQDSSREAAAAAAAVVRESAASRQGPGLWAGVKASLVGVFRFGRRSNHSSPSSDGSKPKAFEVMRPPRRNFAPEPELSARSGGAGGDHADETGSQVGGDARQLNSIGLSKFFQESDRGYEKNSNLVVANPSAMISRTGSLVSTVSGTVGPHGASMRLNRDGSGAAESIRTLRNARSRGAGVGSGLGPNAAVAAATAAAAGAGAGSIKESGLGIDTTGSEHGGATISTSDRESRRTSSALMSGAGSTTGSQLYPPRHSADSNNNLAEALAIEEPLQLDGGGTLKVSRGPEKAVQYFHKNSTAPYSRSIAESSSSMKDQKRLSRSEGGGMSATTIASSSVSAISTPSLLLPPIQTRQFGGDQKVSTMPSASSSPVTKSPTSPGGGVSGLVDLSSSSRDNSIAQSGGVGTDESSPTESQPSPNAVGVAVSAGRMHEILGRMFSDRSIRLHGAGGGGGGSSDHDSDSVLSEDAFSSLSGPTSTTPGRRSLLGHTETTASVDDDDADGEEELHSAEQYDILQPVMEGSDLEDEEEEVGNYGRIGTGAGGEMDMDMTPRQSNFDLVSPTAAATVISEASSSSGSLRTGSRDASATSAEKLPLLATSSVAGSPLSRSQSGSTSPTSSTGSSSTALPRQQQQQQQQGKLRPHQRSIGGRPLAQTPLHEASVHLLRTASGSNSGNASPHLTTATLPIIGGGSGGVSRQSSIHSGATSSPRLEYLDANWMMPDRDGNGIRGSAGPGSVDGGLNRNSSIATVRSEASYVTAYSQYPSDDEEQQPQQPQPQQH